MTTAFLYFAVTAAAAAFARIRWYIAIVLILLPLAFTGRALFTGQVYAPIDLPYAAEPLNWMKPQYGVGQLHNGLLSDVYSHNIPWKAAVRDAYRHGELPLWNPHIFAGDILAAAAQPAVYDPLLLLSLLLPLPNSLTFLASMSLFIAGLGMYLLLRDLHVRAIPAFAGCAAWMFSTFVAFWLEWALGATTVWLPLLIFAVRRVIRSGTTPLREAALLTFVFVMIVLAGHPETALHVVALGALWAAAELVSVRGRGFVRATLLAIGAGVVALLVCAIYLFPVMDALPQTFEHELRRNVFRQMEKSVPLPVAIAKLEAQLVPFIHGMPHREWPDKLPFEQPLESASCGSVALALAVFGAWRSRLRAKWIALGFVILGLILGVRLWPFSDVLAKVPLFDISLNDRLVVAAAFGIAMLAAMGIDATCHPERSEGSSSVPLAPEDPSPSVRLLMTSQMSSASSRPAKLTNRAEGLANLRSRPGRLRMTAVGILIAILLALACANAWSRMLALGLTPAFLRTQAMILIAGPLVVAVIASTVRGRTACALLFLAIVAQRTIEVGDLYPTLPARMFYPPIAVFDNLPKSGEPFRIVGQADELIPNSATLYGLEDVRGYQALRLKRWVETVEIWSVPQGVWWNRVEDLSAPFLSMLNVRYALVPWTVKSPPPPGWRKIADQPGTSLLENTRAFGRAFVPRSVRVGYPKDVALMQIKLERDFSARAWIDARTTVPREEVNGPGRARVLSAKRGQLQIHASMDGGGWMVVSETAWKGWRAFVDGKTAPLRYANHTLLAVYVPLGEHDVRMVYRPESFVIGAWTSAITLLLWTAAASAAAFRRRRRSP